jgi:hypothetical protein
VRYTDDVAVVAFLSLACTPMPFLFYKYGAKLRQNSKYTPSGPDEIMEPIPSCPIQNDEEKALGNLSEEERNVTRS